MGNHEIPVADRRIGALAAATGLSVRALRHYDEIGLLAPSGRSEAGHRLYSTSDVERLYRIRLLRNHRNVNSRADLADLFDRLVPSKRTPGVTAGK